MNKPKLTLAELAMLADKAEAKDGIVNQCRKCACEGPHRGNVCRNCGCILPRRKPRG